MDTHRIIEKFGGQSALARQIDKGPSTVQYWAKAGTIPAKWHPILLELAAEQGLDLSPSDFAAVPDVIEPQLPSAKWLGTLRIGESSLPCFVLNDGRRIISRTGATNILTGTNHGNLESYFKPIRSYLPEDLQDQFVEFELKEVTNKKVMGVTAETFVDICSAYVKAMDTPDVSLTKRQQEIAVQAAMFLAACSKVGLIALIDEVTGYQYDRVQDALQVKLAAYLEDEMRKWEKTFPDQLWLEFGRLTDWKGSVTNRPRYWGKLVMELVYDYLDPDVADWLRDNAPRPQKGQNYHQWLTSQYGLRKLTEHLWLLVGIASTCNTIHELKTRMAERFGRQPVQYTLFLDPPKVYPNLVER